MGQTGQKSGLDRMLLLTAALLALAAAPSGATPPPGVPGRGRTIFDEVPADPNGRRQLWMNWLCTRADPATDAGCRPVPLG